MGGRLTCYFARVHCRVDVHIESVEYNVSLTTRVDFFEKGLAESSDFGGVLAGRA